MAVLTFPSIIPDSQDFGIKYNTQVSSTEISGILQRVEMPGARWVGNMGFKDMTPSESAALKAFLLELRGPSGTFFYGDITHTSPFLAVSGSVTVLAGSSARVIKISRSGPAFSVGDYVQIGADDQRELKMIIVVNNTGGSNYDLTLESMLRRTDYVGLAVTYTNPKGVFFLTSDTQATWSTRSKALLSDMNIEFIEAFL